MTNTGTMTATADGPLEMARGVVEFKDDRGELAVPKDAHILAGNSGFICGECECVQKCAGLLAAREPEPALQPTARYAFECLVRHFAPRSVNEVQGPSSRRIPWAESAAGCVVCAELAGAAMPHRRLATRTENASPAFIKEFLRRMAQHYLEARDS